MASFWKKFSTLIPIYIACCIATADGKRNHTWTHTFGNEIFVQDQTFLTSPGQVYGFCDDSLTHVRDNKFEQTCKFAMETTEPIDSPDHIRLCNFSLNAEISDGKEMYLIEQISAITKDRAVLRLEGINSYLFFVLNFSNCTVANFHVNELPMSLHAPTNDRFDAIVAKDLFPTKIFKTSFDIDGNIISEEQQWFEQASNILAVVDSPTKNRLVVDETKHFINDSSKEGVRIYAASNNGSIEILKEYPVDKKTNTIRSEGIITSTTFNLLSVCSRVNTSLICTQLDSNGTVKFEKEIPLEEFPALYSLKLQNLPRGGFLLFIRRCRKVGESECLFESFSIDVGKVDDTGEIVGTLYFENQKDGGYGGQLHVFESENKEVCISDVHSTEHSDDLTLNVICLNDDDFPGTISWPTE